VDGSDLKDRIRAFVQRHVRGANVDDSTDILASGYVNSMFAMQLVQFVETEFGIAVEDADMEIDNFRSVNALAALVERKRAAGPV
jgi:methoxymalonate biosynthesis acyl carrier protein